MSVKDVLTLLFAGGVLLLALLTFVVLLIDKRKYRKQKNPPWSWPTI